ncbi:chromate resistance protein ChrB domain-containing protein [Zoogloea sp.]|uniref:chromate resistance protein ChrB domain-containing protein n=1 Tax=Zoogloea sp. TaxID=49181 RepID=UPI0014159DA6|nr:MAG: chromate resistance protein [Zoogloea sp.]
MNAWLALITSLPTENATARMRAWRSLKGSGAAVLRDGVYLMPGRDACRVRLDAVAADILASGGSALVLRVEEPEGSDFAGLFDRSREYADLLEEVARARDALTRDAAADGLKQARRLRKVFSALADTDFFPGEAHRQAAAAVLELEHRVAQLTSADEPRPIEIPVPRLDIRQFQGQTWATRARPWVDRLASAWLIRRFIDPAARLLWLPTPADCPAGAVGFDFDGARFSHIGARVTFEVLVASFALESPAINRLGGIVHFLDVGGVQPPEAAGIESALAGLRRIVADDDQLLQLASAILDGLLASFENTGSTP